MTAGLAESYRWASVARTHVGKVRRLNEDAVLDRPDLGLWAVADGMGGHEAGDRASRMVVEALAALAPPAGLDDFVAAAKRQLQAVNETLQEEARDGAGRISGSTVAALLVHGRHGVAIWAGDSRIYLYRNGRLHGLSRDHSQVEEWVKSGLLKRHEASGHPASNVITRAVGADDAVELDTTRIDVLPGDVFLLCSDGLYNEVDEEAMSQALSRTDCEWSAEQLLARALASRARDNISLVIVHAGRQSRDETKTVINPAFAQREQPPRG